MNALQIKRRLEAIDNKIVKALTKAKYKSLTTNVVRKEVVTNGSVATILKSINEYDQVVLSQLAVSSTTNINDQLLKSYTHAKRKLEAKVRKHLHTARRVRAKVKNGR